MIIGIPREGFVDEQRVALGPAGVRSLVEMGTTVYIDHAAGEGAGWSDADYENAGATIAFNKEEVFARADILMKVLPPDVEETKILKEEQVLISFLQLPLAKKEVFESLVDHKITAIGLENIVKGSGGHPVRRAMSEIAAALAVQVGAQYLRADQGGRGILMGGTPGVPPASVGIIGAGVAGRKAASVAMTTGAHVMLLDSQVTPLRWSQRDAGANLQTSTISEHSLEKLCRFVDILIGCVHVEDAKTPHLITREMVQMMKKGSILIDIAVDSGGTSETSHPTTISNPTYVEEGIIHYCVPNMASLVPRTATRAFQAQVLPLVKLLLKNGVEETLRDHSFLNTGLNLYKGEVTREAVATAFHTEWKPAAEILR